MPAFNMAVGKAKPADKYSKCGKGSGDSDNGCGVEECIKGGDNSKKRTGDYLMTTGAGTKPEEARIKDELGWSIRYSFSGSCTTVNNKKP